MARQACTPMRSAFVLVAYSLMAGKAGYLPRMAIFCIPGVLVLKNGLVTKFFKASSCTFCSPSAAATIWAPAKTSCECCSSTADRERSYGSYQRSFDISGVKTEDIKAKYENGVLTLDMPKKTETIEGKHRLAIE